VTAASTSRRGATFEGGLRALAALGLGFALLAVVSGLVGPLVTADARPAWVAPAWSLAKFGALAALALGVFRMEGLAATDLGLAPRLFRPGVLTFAAVYAGVTLLGVGVAVVAGLPWGVDVLVDLPAQWTGIPAAGVATVAFQFLVVGVLEELVFRGYLQTKVVALLGDDSRARVALGVVVAALAFGLMHAPAVLVAGGSPAAVLVVVLARAGTGVAFGALYELTGNVYLVALLHGLGNTWVLLVDWTTWPTDAVVAFFLGVAVVYVGGALAYRSRVGPRDRTGLDRSDAESVDAAAGD
jgi:membrane protease YdiL (CAAX protease family)